MELERYTFVLLRRPPDAPDYPAGRLDETRELMENDPAVRARRLVADVMSWWTTAGSLPASGSS